MIWDHIGARRALAALFTCLVAFAFSPTPVGAINQSDLLTRFGSTGSQAGQIIRVQAIAADSASGHTFVFDGGNNRVEEFTAWGNFVKAFGWDVAPAGVNEQQEVTIKATAGQFRLSFGASTTADLEHDASANDVATALNGLASMAGGSVSVEKGASDSSSSRYVVSFSGGSLKEANVGQLIASNGTIPLSGGTPSSSVAVSTRADGTPGGTGLESCTAESGCKSGIRGTGPGQLDLSFAMAVDASGNLYVRESTEFNQRVQKFDSTGRFLLTFGGEVDKTTKANICTAASGDECGAGTPGTGTAQFSKGFGLAIGTTGGIFAADKSRIQEFEPNGSFKAAIPVPGETVRRLVVDPNNGDFYATFNSKDDVHKLDLTGGELGSLPVANVAEGLATDSTGNVYATEGVAGQPEEQEKLIEFNSSGTQISKFELRPVTQVATALGTNAAGNLLIARSQTGTAADFIELYGPAPVKFEPPPAVPPEITAQFATSVDPEDATVRAEVNPHFWTDARYYLEYGIGKCSEAGCDQTTPAPPGTIVTNAVTDSLVSGSGVLLTGLEPATTYHYRFVAQSGGGGPVRGIGGKVGADGAESAFRTPPLPGSPESGCPNQAFRSGPSAPLPDCRAYEMVSPTEKNNGDIRDTLNVSGFSTGLRQGAPDGESIAYSSYRAFADPTGAPIVSQYLARRGAGGWSSEGLSPARTSISIMNLFGQTENEFKAFSPDLCQAWLVIGAPPPLAPGGLEDFPSLYRRHNCPASYEALNTVEPAGTLPKEFAPEQAPELQGYSADGSKALFRVPFKMSEDAAQGAYQAYEASGGELKLLCILPGETPLGSDCSAGMGAAPILNNRGASVSHAISADGSRIYWTASAQGPGKIYLRVNGAETLPVSETQGSAKAQFLGASADGSSALFMPSEKAKAANLYQYSLEAGESSQIAGEVLGIAGASEDLSHVYFVSAEAIGGEGTAGEPNLYLHTEAGNAFIATLSATDASRSGLLFSDIDPAPVYHLAKATPDGEHLAFISSNPLTGYDNTDAESSQADAEVFQYSADTGELNCVSCNPGGARPQGREVDVPSGTSLRAAALIPPGENQLYTPRAQSDDGNRLFFNSYDSLVSRDTNGVADVYEWERPGTGRCTEAQSAFSPQNGGCIYLISSGTSPVDSELIDSSADGRDVFFTTDASLLPQDTGLIDIYDARAGGGFPAPPSRPAACEGEACQGPYVPPNDPTPGSSSFQGPGNAKETSAAKKHKKKRKHAKKHKQAKKQQHAKGKQRSHR